jgi:hypothetical protein
MSAGSEKTMTMMMIHAMVATWQHKGYFSACIVCESTCVTRCVFWHAVNVRAAAALNMAVFLLIGKTSALTMNVAGVVKDWLLILLSVLMYG